MGASLRRAAYCDTDVACLPALCALERRVWRYATFPLPGPLWLLSASDGLATRSQRKRMPSLTSAFMSLSSTTSSCGRAVSRSRVGWHGERGAARGGARTFISPSKKARSSAYACAGLRRRVAELADGDADATPAGSAAAPFAAAACLAARRARVGLAASSAAAATAARPLLVGSLKRARSTAPWSFFGRPLSGIVGPRIAAGSVFCVCSAKLTGPFSQSDSRSVSDVSTTPSRSWKPLASLFHSSIRR